MHVQFMHLKNPAELPIHGTTMAGISRREFREALWCNTYSDVVNCGHRKLPLSVKWGSYWIQACMSDAEVSIATLLVMIGLRLEHRMSVTCKSGAVGRYVD